MMLNVTNQQPLPAAFQAYVDQRSFQRIPTEDVRCIRQVYLEKLEQERKSKLLVGRFAEFLRNKH